MVGLAVMAPGIVALKRSGLGLGPWDVLHDGLAGHTNIDLGTVGILVGIPIVALWWPLQERPGIGTIANLILVGTFIHLLLPHTRDAHAPALRVLLMAGGIAAFAVGQGMYIAAGLGAGPRDGLMTGLHRRWGWSIRLARTSIELVALIGGLALGGSFGVGTFAFALGIGPMVQVTLRWFGFPVQQVPELGDQPAAAVGLAGE
ncbi:MAG: hypothetical protein JWO37_2537 [Acidimicrobiales bacterium]|nr:hypothetical protein [Acidimicrobiales bacterium]